MPLGLLTLAAGLQSFGYKVKIYKPEIRLIHQKEYKKTAKDILINKPVMIGFSTWCITYPTSLLLAKEIKNKAPEIPIIFGGPQASILADETLKNFSFVDFILSGEADFSFPQFIKEIENSIPDLSTIPGLSYRNFSGIIHHNKLNGSVKNLDELPVPAYELVPQLKWLKLDVGRGCPFKCTYCTTSDFFSKKYRIKSADRIIKEMMDSWQNKKVTSFSFAHDMFTLNKKFVFELCDKLISIKKTTGTVFKWNCSARIDCVSEEMLVKMKAAGCSDIFFGIETGSERIQQIIKKNIKVSSAMEIADICRLPGIRMHASFIIGFPEETCEDLNQTLKAAIKLALKGALIQVSELSLLPGTPIYKEHHLKLKFDGQFSNFSRNYCGKEEIKLIKNYPEIFSSFYYLPVKSISRKEMLFLRLFINKSKDFRNTLFLLSELIEEDVKDVDLLVLFKKEFKKINIDKNDPGAIAMFWIGIIDNYMIKNSSRIKNDFIKDVFAYEAYSALLLSLFSTWELIQPKMEKHNLLDNFLIRPTPKWKVLTVNFKLESVLPSENVWEENSKRFRKGRYAYLLVAESTNKCRRFRIDETDEYLLKAISETTFENFILKIGAKDSKNDVFAWLKKMQKLGVIQFIHSVNKKRFESKMAKIRM